MGQPVCFADAVKALDARKDAVFGGDRATASTGAEMDRLMFSGTGIDPEEAHAISDLAATVLAESLLAGDLTPDAAFQACWLDGVLAGATFARMLSTREAAD